MYTLNREEFENFKSYIAYHSHNSKFISMKIENNELMCKFDGPFESENSANIELKNMTAFFRSTNLFSKMMLDIKPNNNLIIKCEIGTLGSIETEFINIVQTNIICDINNIQ
jgi:hypothetical protein